MLSGHCYEVHPEDFPADSSLGMYSPLSIERAVLTLIQGGLITFTKDSIPAVSAATAAFSANVTDPKAAIITTYNFIAGAPGISLLIFYDDPTPPAGIFDAFLDIPHFTKDIDTRSYLDLVKASPVEVTNGLRSHFQMVPVLEYTPAFLEAVVNQTTVCASFTVRNCNICSLVCSVLGAEA